MKLKITYIMALTLVCTNSLFSTGKDDLETQKSYRAPEPYFNSDDYIKAPPMSPEPKEQPARGCPHCSHCSKAVAARARARVKKRRTTKSTKNVSTVTSEEPTE